MNIDRLLGLGRKKAVEVPDPRHSDDCADFFTFKNVRYRVQTMYNPSLQSTTLLALPNGEMYLAEWSRSVVPPVLTKIQVIPPGMDTESLTTVIATYDRTSTHHHIHLRLE